MIKRKNVVVIGTVAMKYSSNYASEILPPTTSAFTQFLSFHLRFLDFMIPYVYPKGQLRWINIDGGVLNSFRPSRGSDMD
jgi:hypothetical protein